ncbi:IPT/TIG domain-containing protein [Pontibacter sp. BT310]|uniref:IPT/TIG domain-containing protein n=1 Tax=Pontibacter populi TaxID=890055 RepID=A0ABS6X985_9BACT|nr:MULTISPECIES: IPT/TIG domain-containing protein [Pontibacter]MBJ6117670.1 IPT/TIG domain-containing protein [Pontibacter sp. BT310]MBR0570096.1 IPT/TIG domain-containing protein [Microvirga sp. STS03]MBW3364522.1 IPT/TIG domain-containing protein [Pontibacter populi]
MARFYAYPYSSSLIRTLLTNFILVLFVIVQAQAQSAPTISGFTPSSGKVGDVITINGTGFTTANMVYIGSEPTLDFDIVNDNQIKVNVPATASTGKIQVHTGYGSKSSSSNFTLNEAPVISSINPASGTVGTEVTITGSKFTGVTSVSIAGGSVDDFVVISDSEILAKVPVSSYSGNVVVYANHGSAVGPSFSVSGTPTITEFAPAAGPVGTEVTIKGTKFNNVTSLNIAGGTITSFTKVSDTEIKAKVPTSATGGIVRVYSNIGTGVSSSSFSVDGTPTINSFSPASGRVNSEVIITGSNFTNATSVYIGSGLVTDFSIISDTQIKAIVPNTASTGRIQVYTAQGRSVSSFNFAVEGAPVISSFSPAKGVVGTLMTIKGRNFSEASTIYIGTGIASDFTIVSDTEIQVKVPVTGSTGRVQVRGKNGAAVSAGTFTVTGAPVIASFSPSSGPAGTEVTILGENFTGTYQIYVGNGSTSSFTVVSDKEIRVRVPESATSGSVLVRTGSGQVYSTGTYTVTGAPEISSFSPVAGPVGTLVTIKGINFTGINLIYIGTGIASDFTIVSDTEIQVKVPVTGSTGRVQVRGKNGAAVSAGTFTVTGAPVIASFSPSSGPAGTEVTILGENFTGTYQIYVGNGSTSSFTVVSDKEIRVRVPESATSGSVLVRTGSGQVYSTGTYTVTPAHLTTPQELTFNSKPVGGSESKEYQVSGLGLKNGEAVTLTVSESSPYTISKTADATGFGKTLTLTGVTNNRLNPIQIFVKYTATEAGEGFPAVITHSQGSITRAMDVRVVAPLPVELTSFTASLKGGIVNLEWSTASEKNNSHFEIEMSKSSLNNFRKIDSVKSKVENSSTKTQYSFSSNYSSNGETEYYRLKQVDFDGAYAYSKIVAVKPVMLSKPMEVAPNPLEADSKVYFTAENEGTATIRVTSITGKQVYFERIDVHAGENVVLLSKYNNLMAGVYIVTVDHSGKREYVRIEKR